MMPNAPDRIRRGLRLVALVAALAVPAAAEPVVFGAASTGRALDAAIAASGLTAVTSYSASGTLARQIELGAPADVFVSANPRWMEHLVDQGLVDADAVREIMSNRLVLIAPQGRAFDAARPVWGLDGEIFVMADPAVAPVGRYGRTALERLGFWGALGPHYVPTRNTLATVAAVASGEAALGLVYASDAVGRAGVDVVWTVPPEMHPPVRYLVAPVVQGEDTAAAARLMAFLLSAPGQAILQRFGFLAARAHTPAGGV